MGNLESVYAWERLLADISFDNLNNLGTVLAGNDQERTELTGALGKTNMYSNGGNGNLSDSDRASICWYWREHLI